LYFVIDKVNVFGISKSQSALKFSNVGFTKNKMLKNQLQQKLFGI